MKKFFLYFSILIMLNACNRDRGVISTSDFSKSQKIILKPYQLKPYAMFKIKVNGYANDTIRINYNLYGNSNYFLVGKIDTLLVQTDYYGEGPITIIFDPYKATKGELEIDASL